MKEYKSPFAALLWSIVMSGFGQYYNGQYIFGSLLLLLEITSNVLSGLNTAIMFSFHGDLKEAHNIFNPQWGLFYPSTYLFGIWQAYNKAIIINYQQDGEEPTKETYLTGFFFGCVVGMNLGVYWHPDFLNKIHYIEILYSPILNGLILGVTIGFIGHFIERHIKRKRVKHMQV